MSSTLTASQSAWTRGSRNCHRPLVTGTARPLHGARSPLRRSKPAVQAGRPRRRRRLDDPADDGQSKHVAPVEVEPQQAVLPPMRKANVLRNKINRRTKKLYLQLLEGDVHV